MNQGFLCQSYGLLLTKEVEKLMQFFQLEYLFLVL